MTLNEACERYLHKTCDIGWGPLDRPARNNETIPYDTIGIVVKEIYVDLYGRLMFKCVDRITVPFEVSRLKNPR